MYKEYKPDKPVSKGLKDSHSLKAAQCPVCKETFSSYPMFDKHKKRVSCKIDDWRLICLDPADCGMSLNDRGYWTIPNEVKWWEDK